MQIIAHTLLNKDSNVTETGGRQAALQIFLCHIEWHNPKSWHGNLFRDGINILYKRGDYLHSQKPEQEATPLILRNSNFRHILQSPSQSFMAWNELGWNDYTLIIPSCMLQCGNGIPIGIGGRSLRKKGKGYLRSGGASGDWTSLGKSLKKGSGKPETRHESRGYLEEQKMRKGRRANSRTKLQQFSVFSDMPSCLQLFYPLNPTHQIFTKHQIFN